MTTNRKLGRTKSGNLSLIPEPDLGLRVTRAQFSRMVGVSRTQVTRWVQAGLIAVAPDNTFDPHKAYRRLIEHLDPTRTRIHLVQSVAQEMADLRAAAKRAGDEAAEWRARAEVMESGWREMDRAVELLLERIIDAWDELAALPVPRRQPRLDELLDEAILAAADELGAPGTDTAAAGPVSPLAAESAGDAGDTRPETEGGCGDLDRGAGRGDG